MVDWTKLPDLAAVALLTCAFASVARRGQTPVSRFWLTGWILIAVHFAAFMFLPSPGAIGVLAADIGLAALPAAGLLFTYASIPYRREQSSRWVLVSLLFGNALYVCLINASPAEDWALIPAAALLGIAPLFISLFAARRFRHPMRWVVVALYCLLSAFILIVQKRPNDGGDLALNALLFTVFFVCCLHFSFTYRRATAGAFITISGFLAWASVFLVAPSLQTFFPTVQIESEVWNLPKYVVAVGMILLLLEDQLEHNTYLAFHDELTGLPNRRLFQDRLGVALERARRSSSKAALLVIDLDRFKEVNDTMGHHFGDILLQQVGLSLAGSVRNCDTVSRTGGDEFSVILEGTANPEDAYKVAQTLLTSLNEPLEIEGRMVRVGASIGVALYPDDAADMEALCIAADLRMYDKKKVARSALRSPLTGKILPQGILEDAVRSDFRIAPENLSA